ncbi:hypothetical protein EGW08_000544, partial [Elysia chlorotica]
EVFFFHSFSNDSIRNRHDSVTKQFGLFSATFKIYDWIPALTDQTHSWRTGYFFKMIRQPGWHLYTLCVLIVLTVLFHSCTCKGKEEKTKDAEKIKKKDIRDYSDADMERLFDQWEDSDEDELEEDELPEWKRKPPAIDITRLDMSNPAEVLKASKKGRTLMMFATVSGNPTEEESEKISMLWHSQLFNAHVDMQRYVVGPNRVLFMLKDGAKAWEVKDFLVTQERCEEVTIENQNFPGAGAAAKGKKQDQKKSKKEKSEL